MPPLVPLLAENTKGHQKALVVGFKPLTAKAVGTGRCSRKQRIEKGSRYYNAYAYG